MAEALAVISLINNIATFVDITIRVVNRLQEFDETSTQYGWSVADVKAQLPLLIEITKDISERCQQRIQAGRAEALSER